MLSLHNIKSNKGRIKKSKRVGRGNASGKGTYSSRGQKGQKSRSGVSNLKRLGLRSVILQTPKSRGFKSAKPKNQVVKAEDINKNFTDKEIITPRYLLTKGLIDTVKEPIKILGKEKITVKVEFDKSIKMSESVKKQFK